jgi:hypothetical protein
MEGSGMNMFFPAHGLGNPMDTRYAYEGGKDFFPFFQPVATFLMFMGACWYSGRFLWAVCRVEKLRHPPGKYPVMSSPDE